MRNLHHLEINKLRRIGPNVVCVQGSIGDDKNGFFQVGPLLVIVTCGEGWEHISVSHPDRIPTWEEMDAIHKLFFEDDEVAMQLHIPAKEHINYHPYCLHIWRPIIGGIPRPPNHLV